MAKDLYKKTANKQRMNYTHTKNGLWQIQSNSKNGVYKSEHIEYINCNYLRDKSSIDSGESGGLAFEL